MKTRSVFLWPRHAARVLLVTLLASGCSEKKAPAAKAAGAPVPAVVAKAVEKDMPVQIHAIGNVQAYSTVTIRSQVTGQLVKIHFQEGQEVKKGDLLFSIDRRPFAGMLEAAKANLARDTAQLENARVEHAREQKLLEANLVSRDEYEKAEAMFKALQGTVMADQAGVSNATLNLEFTEIRSPINGRTGNLLAHEGNIIKAPDDQMLTITQVHPIYVSFGVPEQSLPEIRKRMRETKLMVSVNYVNLDKPRPAGVLSFIDNTVDPTTGLIQLKATFDNTDDALWPGQFVEASLQLSEQARAVVVPSQAIQTGQKGEFIFVVKDDQSVELRPVTLGLMEKGETVIKSGIKAGETVVIDGQLRLVPGAKINAKPPVNEEPNTKIGGGSQ
ncbi:MAG TPA: efflux RND transporter periplasmic adaptor subunit [Verrucomicrobiae bacterium]|nr:efflux RND transporter periplasmic adaptor subunit [Verrucomicrobiae bacterium]